MGFLPKVPNDLRSVDPTVQTPRAETEQDTVSALFLERLHVNLS